METVTDQGISAPSHALRLVLVFLGTVLGLLVLSFVFGSSSARADDGADTPDSLGSAVGGLVSQVTEPVAATVHAVSHTVTTTPVTAPVVAVVKPVAAPVAQALQATPVGTLTTPVAALADTTVTKVFGQTPLGEVLGTTPVGSILDPVVTLIDGTVATVGESVATVIGGTIQTTAPIAIATIDVAPAAASALISGVAAGALDVRDSLGASGTGTSGLSSSGGSVLAALAGAGFIVLLALRRQTLTARAMPGSPVYETDSSPD